MDGVCVVVTQLPYDLGDPIVIVLGEGIADHSLEPACMLCQYLFV